MSEIYLKRECVVQNILCKNLDYTLYVGNIPEERVIGVPGTMHHLFVDDPLSVIDAIKKLIGEK